MTQNSSLLQNQHDYDYPKSFSLSPRINSDLPSFNHIVERLRDDGGFIFSKLNHGFWERLARLRRLGVQLDEISRCHGSEIDKALGIPGQNFAAGGLLVDLLDRLPNLPDPCSGFEFVASLEPWPLSEVIEGTPFENTETCNSIIQQLVPREHLENASKVGYTGHEMKAAAITGRLNELINCVSNRHVVLISSENNSALFRSINIKKFTHISIDHHRARHSRFDILQNIAQFYQIKIQVLKM